MVELVTFEGTEVFTCITLVPSRQASQTLPVQFSPGLKEITSSSKKIIASFQSMESSVQAAYVDASTIPSQTERNIFRGENLNLNSSCTFRPHVSGINKAVPSLSVLDYPVFVHYVIKPYKLSISK